MVFSNPEFVFFFLPTVLCLFALARRSGGAGLVMGVLLAFSITLYAYSEPLFLPIVLALVATNHAISDRLRRTSAERRWTWFWIGVTANLIPFLYLKYLGFSLEGENSAARWLPLGLSFFTFQQIAFLNDVRTGTAPQVPLWKYGLFVMFFPHLIAGPIVRHNELLGQLTGQTFLAPKAVECAAALSLFSIALFKKLVVADHLGVPVDLATAAINDGRAPSAIEAWSMMMGGAAQIYYDYSAYADMAIALALVFGIRLPISFYSPYQATSISDFWRRWNITLMRFFRDHVYIPLGGNRHGRVRQAAAIVLTMLACGFWHGAGAHYLIWGLLVGALVVLDAMVLRRLLGADAPTRGRRVLGRALVLLAYVGPLSFFLFPDSGRALVVLQGLVGFASTETLVPFVLTPKQWVLLVAAWAGIYLVPNTFLLFRSVLESPWIQASTGFANAEAQRAARLAWAPSVGWLLLTATLLAVCLTGYGFGENKAFYYFRF